MDNIYKEEPYAKIMVILMILAEFNIASNMTNI